ncbi:MAG: hypothetical protein AB1505_30175 [Candidatus Latescibacterota bacterium]
MAHLQAQGRLRRQQLGGAFIYLSATGGDLQLQRRRQAVARQASTPGPTAVFALPQVADRLPVFLSVLYEKQRWLYAGFESLKLGRSGDDLIAGVTALNIKTVARGRRELLAGGLSMERISAVGARRPSLTRKSRAEPTGTYFPHFAGARFRGFVRLGGVGISP